MMGTMVGLFRSRFVVCGLLLGLHSSVQAGPVHFQFQPLGPLPPDVYGFSFSPSNLSPSGCSIAGDYLKNAIVQGAWESEAGFVPLEIPANYPEFRRTSLNSAINDNGLIAGRFVWRYDAGAHEYKYIQELPSVFSIRTVAQAVAMSSDGLILGGWSATGEVDGSPDYLATIWRPSTPSDPDSLYTAEALLPLAGDDESAIQDMSRDGTVMVGYSLTDNEEFFPMPVLWKPNVNSSALPLPTPTLPQGGGRIITLISPKGNKIVVTRCEFFGGEVETCLAILTNQNSTVAPLDLRLPYAVSDNGVVVGEKGVQRSIVLSASYLGPSSRPLSQILTHAGMTEAEATAWLAASTFDISADGRTLLGPGINPDTDAQGLIKIQLPLPGDTNDNEHVNLTDFAALKNSYGQNGTTLPTDFNFDMTVSSADFSILLNHFGQEGLPPTLGTCFPS